MYLANRKQHDFVYPIKSSQENCPDV